MFGTIFNETKLGERIKFDDKKGSIFVHGVSANLKNMLSLYTYEKENRPIIYILKDDLAAKEVYKELIDIKGDTFFEQLRYIASFNEIANTNIDAVFDLILNAAVKNYVKQDEIPHRLVIISDMEFDMCVEGAQISNFERAKRKYESYGYKLPEIVFWNVVSRHGYQAVRANEQGVILVSGFSPNIFKMVAEGSCEPYNFMIDVLMSKRYENISA